MFFLFMVFVWKISVIKRCIHVWMTYELGVSI